MLKLFFTVTLVLVQFESLHTQKLQSGKCPIVTSVPNFDINAFSGTWYDIASIPIPTLRLGKCISATYGVDSSNVVRISINYLDGKQAKQLNNAFAITNSSGAYFIEVPSVDMKFNFAIIDTDYSSYGVTYGCAKLTGFRVQLAWILSRQPTLSKDLYAQAVNALKQRKLPSKQLKNINQSNCPQIY